mmetsp:Transcript_89901/g.159967  ORF Transcript_89901/g.159967 Transcript_89901/m.159967 type:complete len:603 (-) Transcript_89901:53-1861(-)
MMSRGCRSQKHLALALLAGLLLSGRAERPEVFEGGSDLELDEDDADSPGENASSFVAINSVSTATLQNSARVKGNATLKSHANSKVVSNSIANLAVISHTMVNLSMSEQSTLELRTQSGVGGEAASTALKIAAVTAALYAAFKCLSALWFSRKCDCRRWKGVAKALRESGYDEFETFEMLVSVHFVQDIQDSGLLGKKEFKVVLSFNYNKAETSGTKDMRWEQTLPIEVPQGAVDGRMVLMSLGTVTDTTIATVALDTKKDMLDKGDEFFGKKQKFVMRKKGKTVGTLGITFRKKGSGELSASPIEGLDDDSALYVDVMTRMQELIKKKKIPQEYNTLYKLKPGEKVDGDAKVYLLAESLEGALRKINLEDSKELGKCYVRVMRCNFSELKGKEKERRKELERQVEKAAKKGLKQVERKWYVALYPSKSVALDGEKWHDPDEFFPLASITSVHRSPNYNDQFLVNYAPTGKKQTLCFRRDAGKALDSWVEGFEMAFQEVRETLAETEEAKDLHEKEIVTARGMHQAWLAKNGLPQNQEHWSAWYQYLKSANLEEETIRTLYKEVTAGPTDAQQDGKAKGKGKFKGKFKAKTEGAASEEEESE